MNHLVGALPLANPIEQVITAGEAEPLAKFKAAYMAHADADKAEPVWTISPESLPESGWRALDDVTLLRFLRADMRKGVFYPETSMARLLHALAWRKRMGSDALLAQPADDAYEHMRIRRWVGFDKQGRHQAWRAASEKNAVETAAGPICLCHMFKLPAVGAGESGVINLCRDMRIEITIGAFRPAKGPMDIEGEPGRGHGHGKQAATSLAKASARWPIFSFS